MKAVPRLLRRAASRAAAADWTAGGRQRRVRARRVRRVECMRRSFGCRSFVASSVVLSAEDGMNGMYHLRGDSGLDVARVRGTARTKAKAAAEGDGRGKQKRGSDGLGEPGAEAPFFLGTPYVVGLAPR